MANLNAEESKNMNRDLSHDELDLHELMLRRSKLKSTVRTSTLLAGFAMVSYKCERHVFIASRTIYVGRYG